MKKKIVITGSEGLIGRELKKYFSRKYKVISLDLVLGHNLMDEKFVEDWFAKNHDIYGLIVLHAYNPVPVKNSKRIEPVDISLEEIRNYFETNTISTFNLCRHFIKNNKKGVIINMSSIYGSRSPKHFIYKDFVKSIAYGMSKAAIVNMSRYLASYYAPNFRINTVVFGGVADSKQDPVFVELYSKNTPMKRLMALEEIHTAFEFLLDEKSSYITGTEVVVDGGWLSW